MNLETVSKYSIKIDTLVRRIEGQIENKAVLESMDKIIISRKPIRGGGSSFQMVETSYVGINNPSVKAFKTLLMEEIDEQIAAFEKELAELIKKGIE